jgi:hypothetical protein
METSVSIDFYKSGGHGHCLKTVGLRGDRVRPGKKIVGADLEWKGFAAHRGLGSLVNQSLQPRNCIAEIGILHHPHAGAQQTLMAAPLRGTYLLCSKDSAPRPLLARVIFRMAANGGWSRSIEVLLAI